MKRIALSLLLMLIAICGWAQTKDSIDQCQIVVAYDYRCNTFDKNGSAVVDSFKLAVLVGTHTTKCAPFYRTMTEDFGEWKNRSYQEGEWFERQNNIPTIYINYPEGEMTTLDKIIPQWYEVRCAIPAIDWKMTDDTLNVGGYLCHKAVGKYAGRKWTAWYTEDIATTAGPWKLRGLPGLIMKTVDADNIHSFEFCGLQNRKDKIGFNELEQMHLYTKTDQRKFIKNRNKVFTSKRYVQDPRYYITEDDLKDAVEMWAAGPEPAPEDKVTVFSRDMVVPKKAHVYQPLELE